MFRTVALAGIVALAIGPSPENPQARRVNLEGPDCSQINMMFDDSEVGRAEQRTSIRAPPAISKTQVGNGSARNSIRFR